MNGSFLQETQCQRVSYLLRERRAQSRDSAARLASSGLHSPRHQVGLLSAHIKSCELLSVLNYHCCQQCTGGSSWRSENSLTETAACLTIRAFMVKQNLSALLPCINPATQEMTIQRSSTKLLTGAEPSASADTILQSLCLHTRNLSVPILLSRFRFCSTMASRKAKDCNVLLLLKTSPRRSRAS